MVSALRTATPGGPMKLAYTTALVAIAALGAGCLELESDLDDDDLSDLSQAAGGWGTGGGGGSAPPEIPTQGIHLLGESLDGLTAPPGRMFSVKLTGKEGTSGNTQLTVRFTGDAALTVSPTNAIFTGTVRLRPTSNGPGELLVQWSRTDVGEFGGKTKTAALYRLAWRATAGSGTFSPLCNGGLAYPIYHDYTSTRLHAHPAAGVPSDRVSFACKDDGAAGKCSFWGYLAGGVYDDESDHPWPVHQACTRMVNDDMCATGIPHTREGTSIQIFDELGVYGPPPDVFAGVTVWPPPPTEFFFEAGWRGDDQPVACLSKLRWSSLPVNGLCPAILPDPRVSVNVQTCDEILNFTGDLEHHEWPNAIANLRDTYDVRLFNVSRYNEIGMYPWRWNADRVTTIDGYLDDNTILRPYHNGYQAAPPTLDGLLLRAPPAGYNPGDVEAIALYANGPDHIYMTEGAEQLLGWPPSTRVATKGFLYTEQGLATKPAGTLAPFYMHERDLGGDYTTSTDPELNGYTQLGIIGYTMVPEAVE
jgi:hypothetical protein